MIEEDDLGLIGFMFDNQHRKILKEFSHSDKSLEYESIGDDPGHVQSGQYIWPGSSALAIYLINNWSAYILPKLCGFGSESDNEKDERIPSSSLDALKLHVLELGAGCGVAGLICAQLAQVESVTLTDYDPGRYYHIIVNIPFLSP
jgi:hypothetical protein